MDNPQDCLVTSSQDIIPKVGPSTSGNPVAIYQNRNGRKKKIKGATEQLPWFLSFQKQCRSTLGSTSMKELLNLITVYTEHISRDVEACYSKPNRAAKLKSNMINILSFFNQQYVLMKQPFEHSAYMEKISNLLTLYFDMEVKASRRGKESVKRITSKLISAFFIILNNSAEYILDTILKARLTVKTYSEICIPIFKMVTDLPQSQEMNYVRCLLVFKLWKRMLPCREERNSINRLAVAKLSPPPAQVLEFLKRGLLTKVLPTPPPDKKPSLITRFYMTKRFNLREAIKAFLKMEADLKLNDFTSALDNIQFFNEEDKEEDKVTEQKNLDKDDSLLETIWIDISNSPSSPDQPSLSSPSTPRSLPSKVSVCRNNRTLETDKAILSNLKKNLFKPKIAKKSKLKKSKVKEKCKKEKENSVIDLSKDNDENCPEVTLDVSDSVNSSFDTTKSTNGESTNLDNKTQSEINSSNGLKLSCKSVKKRSVVESKTVVKSKTNSEISLVSKSSTGCKSKQNVCNTPSQLIDENDFTSNVLSDTTFKSEIKSDMNLKLKSIENKQDLLATKSKVKPDTLEVLVESKDIENASFESNSDEASSVAMDLDEVESSKNKIVISCKNFSRIGFKHEEMEERLEKSPDEEPEELKPMVKENEDPIFKTEILKEDSLHFNDDEVFSDKLLPTQSEQDPDSEETSWSKCLTVDSQCNKLATQNTIQDGCNNDCRSSESILNIKINCNPTPDFISTCHEESLQCSEKVPNEEDDKPSEQVTSEVSANFKDDSLHTFGKESFSVQNRMQETNRSKQNTNNPVNNKIVTIRDIHGKHLQIIVNTDNKQDFRSKSVLKPSSAVQNLKKGDCLSVLSGNSNNNSPEVSSSSLSFEEGYQTKNSRASNLSNNSFDTKQESLLCKAEKEHFKQFTSCMRDAEPSHEELNYQLKEKCDKNTQVPSKTFSYVINKPDFIESSYSSTIPKDGISKTQDFNLQKGLNTCLLHKILGEDCLKNGCLLKSSVTEKFPQDFKKRDFSDVSLKQELENSTELPCENSTPTIPSLWNPSAGIKLEKGNENIKSSECTRRIRSTSSEFLVRSVTEACNFKELDYNVGGESNSFMASCEFESDNEDINLVIDEDIDSIKDHAETEDIHFNYGIDYMQNSSSNNIVSPVLLSNNNPSMKVNDRLVDKNLTFELVDSQARKHKENPPRINNIAKEKESLKRELSGKHKLPRIVESNIKTSYLRASVDSSIKCRPTANNEVLHTMDNSTPCVLTQHYGEDTASLLAKHYSQTKIIKQSDGNVNIGHMSPGCRLFSPHSASQISDSNCVRLQNRDPRLASANVSNNIYQQKSTFHSNPNNQANQIKSLQNMSSINKSVFTTDLPKSSTPRLVPSSGCHEIYTQYNLGSNMTVPGNKSRGSPVDRYGQRNIVQSEKYKGMDKTHQKGESPKLQENCINNSQSNIGVYAELGNSKNSSNQAFLKYNANDHQTMKTGEPMYETTSHEGFSMRDPLCLVKNKDDPRETYDFEFNVFPIAQEIEICSASENIVGDWLYPVSSEIGHPDWPIANEQNVIDSSGSYSQSPDQYMISLLRSDEGCAITEAEQNSYASLELQQIDNRQPNIVGKNINKEKLNLHLRTLESDISLNCSQREFKEFYLSRDIPPTIPVPFPLQNRTDNLNTTVRCLCDQCADNHQKLLSNYNLLTHFRNSKVKPLSVFPKSDEASYIEKDPNGEFDCSLPLKKRKTLTNSKTSDELQLPSYPNTPMISIAQLELTGYEQSNQVIVPNPQSQWRDSVTYNPLNLVQSSSIEPFDGQTKGKRKSTKRRKSSR